MTLGATMQGESPLAWPTGRARTRFPRRSKFGTHRTFESARQLLAHELRLAGATSIVLSTNLLLRRTDGLPYSDQRRPTDSGVAVYFKHNRRDTVLACDAWDRPECNVVAIAKHVEAMRGQERWGVATLEQAFTAYQALPEHAGGQLVDTGRSRFREVLGIDARAPLSREMVDDRFRELARSRHPDAGGSTAEFAELSRARDAAVEEIDAQRLCANGVQR